MMAVKCNDLNEQQRGTKFHLGWISSENERSRRVTRASSRFLSLFFFQMCIYIYVHSYFTRLKGMI